MLDTFCLPYNHLALYTVLTLTFLSLCLPLYHVITAGGLEPAESHTISYAMSATRGDRELWMRAVRGFTVEHRNKNIITVLFVKSKYCPTALITLLYNIKYNVERK